MACTPNQVATPAKEFIGVSEKVLLGMAVYLLAQIALESNPGMDISPGAIGAASECYTCGLSHKALLGAMVYLLCLIEEGGGGGGGGTIQVYTGAAPPAAPADPTKAAIWYPTAGGLIKEWTGAAWV